MHEHYYLHKVCIQSVELHFGKCYINHFSISFQSIKLFRERIHMEIRLPPVFL